MQEKFTLTQHRSKEDRMESTFLRKWPGSERKDLSQEDIGEYKVRVTDRVRGLYVEFDTSCWRLRSTATGPVSQLAG